MDGIRQENPVSLNTDFYSESASNTHLAFALLTACLAASLLIPAPGQDGRIMHLPSPCLFYHATGLPCPACGLTRAFVCIGHGRFMDSFYWHPLGVLIYAVFVLLWLEYGVRIWKKRRLFSLSHKLRARLLWGGLALFLITGFSRMGWLAVHHLSF